MYPLMIAGWQWIAVVVLIGLIWITCDAVSKGNYNKPTMKGVIISFLIGMLPLYIILCIFGWMGEKKD